MQLVTHTAIPLTSWEEIWYDELNRFLQVQVQVNMTVADGVGVVLFSTDDHIL